ncbi:MAG: hypothetical protein Tsb0034_00940 [Ekhidna sp.]
MVWSDEFDYEGAPDDGKWFHQTQFPVGNSWFNGELQHYTNRTENALVEDGVLKITARKENFTDQGTTKNYTSARLNSKFAFTKGRVEVRAKIPAGAGTWPAIWTLGKNINENGGYWDDEFGTTSWPACGEIDIMEHWGSNQDFIQSAMHTPSSFGGTINKGGQTINTATTDFHVYGLEWTDDKMIFDVDGVVHYTYQPATQDANTWPFESDQYLLLNIAIEGNMPSVNPGFSEATMEIDYVRVYQISNIESPDFAAPLPLEEANQVISIFSDSYTDIDVLGYAEEGKAGFEEVELNGNNTLRYDPTADENGNYSVIDFGESNVVDMKKSGLTNFQFDVWFAENLTSDSELIIKLIDPSLPGSAAIISLDDSSTPSISNGKWISYDFTLEELLSLGLNESADIQKISIDVGKSGTVFIDNVYFYGSKNTVLSLASNNYISVYPNPVLETLTIDINGLDTNSKAVIYLIDATGRVLATLDSQKGSTRDVDVSNYPKGIYNVSIPIGAQRVTKKFLKK